jgi:hypothetical protein
MLLELKQDSYNPEELGCIGQCGKERIVVICQGQIVRYDYPDTAERDAVFHRTIHKWRAMLQALRGEPTKEALLVQIKRDHYNPTCIGMLGPLGDNQISITVSGIKPWEYDYPGTLARDEALATAISRWENCLSSPKTRILTTLQETAEWEKALP